VPGTVSYEKQDAQLPALLEARGCRPALQLEAADQRTVGGTLAGACSVKYTMLRLIGRRRYIYLIGSNLIITGDLGRDLGRDLGQLIADDRRDECLGLGLGWGLELRQGVGLGLGLDRRDECRARRAAARRRGQPLRRRAPG